MSVKGTIHVKTDKLEVFISKTKDLKPEVCFEFETPDGLIVIGYADSVTLTQ